MKYLDSKGLLAVAGTSFAQQIYIGTTGPTPLPQCSESGPAQPSFTFRNFSFTLSETVRTAISVLQPTTTSTYAAPYGNLSTLLSNASYTTWGAWRPNATSTASDFTNPYGDAAWSALWNSAESLLPNFTTGIYSTTVSPTPVATSDLILPPPNYFGPTDCYKFPQGFKFGVSSSAAQIEGATAEEGKGPTLLDILVQDARPKDYVTNEHYYLYKQDIQRVAAMGVKEFSLSIAWSRILPFALPGTPINQEAIDHYSNVINYILEVGMIPSVTLLHFDTPLQFYGANLSSFRNPPAIGYVNGAYQNETFTDSFVNYAKIIMAHLADRVAVWYTFNEPLLYSFNGISINNVIKAHAQVYHFYKEELGGKGQISIKFNDNFGVPRNISNEADVFAANHFNSFQLATFANPIFLGQDYPESFKRTITDYVPLTQQDLHYIGGTADYLGIDPYTATVITPPVADDIDSIWRCADNTSDINRPYCVNQTNINQYGWNIGYRSQSYVYITPTYLREYLGYLYNTFRTPVVVTEFGFPVYGESDKTALEDQLYDTPRSLYYLSFMSEVLKAIWEDGVDVRGAFAWSFADNWEFGDYESHFGIQTVNRTTQERRYKKSFFDLVDFMAARLIE